MKSDRLLDAFANISDDYIAEASPENAVAVKRPPRRYLKWGVIAASFLICALLLLPIYQYFFASGENTPHEMPPIIGSDEGNPTEPPVETATEETSSVSQWGTASPPVTGREPATKTGSTTEKTDPSPWNDLVINKAKKMTIGSLPEYQFSQYEGGPADARVPFDDSAFEELLGMGYGIFTEKIPSQYVLSSFFSRDIAGMPHDYVFEYDTENGVSLRITLSKDGVPLRDYDYITTDKKAPKMSLVGSVPILIYGCDELMIVRFHHENVAYELEIRDTTLYTIWSLVKALI